jgi:hypothetical protein
MSLLAVTNAVCIAISIAIIHFAFRDWPIRYADHTLSWSVVLFFLVFVSVSVVGAISAGLYVQRKHEILLRVAAAPAFLLGIGFALGLLKAVLTGDF